MVNLNSLLYVIMDNFPTLQSATITSFSSGWAVYATGTDNAVTVRKYGRVVTLTGAVKNTAAKTLNTSGILVFTIPEGFRPMQVTRTLHQGTDTGVWLCDIRPDGSVYFARYRLTAATSGTYPSVAAGSWFPFHITYICNK